MNKYEEALACAEFYLENAKRRIQYDKGKVLGEAEIAQKNIDVIDNSIIALHDLVDKYNKHQEYHHPLLEPCVCGHNRRNRYVKWATDRHQKLWGYECKGCGLTVWADSEMGAKHAWNNEIKDRKARESKDQLVDNNKRPKKVRL